MKETIPKKPLPPTGGVPLLGPAALGLAAFVATGFVIFQLAVRRDR